MTIDDAKIIRAWRESGASYRSISIKATIKWPDRDYLSDNQIEGTTLCKEAAKLLGEDPWKEPWN